MAPTDRIRKERKVKPGFTPTEDVARFRPSRILREESQRVATNTSNPLPTAADLKIASSSRPASPAFASLRPAVRCETGTAESQSHLSVGSSNLDGIISKGTSGPNGSNFDNRRLNSKPMALRGKAHPFTPSKARGSYSRLSQQTLESWDPDLSAEGDENSQNAPLGRGGLGGHDSSDNRAPTHVSQEDTMRNWSMQTAFEATKDTHKEVNSLTEVADSSRGTSNESSRDLVDDLAQDFGAGLSLSSKAQT